MADGDPSIWKSAEEVFYEPNEVLDIYHALEHISDYGKMLFGEGTAEFKKWREETTLELLNENGSAKFFERLSFLKLEVSLDKIKRTSIDSLKSDLRRNEGRLGHDERLCSGRSMGSGQTEGACKNLVGRRWKQTGGRWCVPNANRMVTAIVTLYTNQWGK